MEKLNQKAEELVLFCKRAYERRYICGTEGNLSIRLSENKLLITPKGLNKGFITADDLITCNMSGRKLDGIGEPSSEIRIHTAIYGQREEVNAVCHTHPAFATAFSICGIPFNEAILPEFILSLGVVPLVKYATPGSERLASNLLEVVGKHEVFLLESHGALALGRTLSEAFDRTEILEHYSRILFYARQMGSLKLIPETEVARLLEIGGRGNLADTIISREDDD